MFSRTVFRIIIGLIIVGLLVGGGFALYRVGWMQGHNTVQISDGGEVTMMHPGHFPSARFAMYPHMRGMTHFFPGGGLLLACLPIFSLLLLAGAVAHFSRRRWYQKMAAEHGAPPWAEGWHGFHGGPCGPMKPHPKWGQSSQPDPSDPEDSVNSDPSQSES
jgi:hypothetical protein